MWKRIVAAQVLWLGVTGTALALTETDKVILKDIGAANYLTEKCPPDADVRFNASQEKHLIWQHIDYGKADRGPSDGAKRPYTAEERAVIVEGAIDAIKEYGAISPEQRCNDVAPRLFGSAGVRRVGLVFSDPYPGWEEKE